MVAEDLGALEELAGVVGEALALLLVSGRLVDPQAGLEESDLDRVPRTDPAVLREAAATEAGGVGSWGVPSGGTSGGWPGKDPPGGPDVCTAASIALDPRARKARSWKRAQCPAGRTQELRMVASDGVLRLSVGLEHQDDILQDVLEAIEKA